MGDDNRPIPTVAEILTRRGLPYTDVDATLPVSDVYSNERIPTLHQEWAHDWWRAECALKAELARRPRWSRPYYWIADRIGEEVLGVYLTVFVIAAFVRGTALFDDIHWAYDYGYIDRLMDLTVRELLSIPWVGLIFVALFAAAHIAWKGIKYVFGRLFNES